MFSSFDHDISVAGYPLRARFFYESTGERVEVTSCYLITLEQRLKFLPLPERVLETFVDNIPKGGASHERTDRPRVSF